MLTESNTSGERGAKKEEEGRARRVGVSFKIELHPSRSLEKKERLTKESPASIIHWGTQCQLERRCFYASPWDEERTSMISARSSRSDHRFVNSHPFVHPTPVVTFAFSSMVQLAMRAFACREGKEGKKKANSVSSRSKGADSRGHTCSLPSDTLATYLLDSISPSAFSSCLRRWSHEGRGSEVGFLSDRSARSGRGS